MRVVDHLHQHVHHHYDHGTTDGVVHHNYKHDAARFDTDDTAQPRWWWRRWNGATARGYHGTDHRWRDLVVEGQVHVVEGDDGFVHALIEDADQQPGDEKVHRDDRH